MVVMDTIGKPPNVRAEGSNHYGVYLRPHAVPAFRLSQPIRSTGNYMIPYYVRHC